jgi:hypothetical protein
LLVVALAVFTLAVAVLVGIKQQQDLLLLLERHIQLRLALVVQSHLGLRVVILAVTVLILFLVA